MLQLNKAIYLTDKYRASEFQMSFNIILFGNRIASLLYKMLNKNRSEHNVVFKENICKYSTFSI